MLNLNSRLGFRKLASEKIAAFTPSLKTLDERVSQVLTHPTFLRSASVMINMNSYRRKWTRAAVRSALVSLEIPVRTDQERMLALLEQLNTRLQDLEENRTSEAANATTEALEKKGSKAKPSVNHANH